MFTAIYHPCYEVRQEKIDWYEKGHYAAFAVPKTTPKLEFVHITKTGGTSIELAGARAGICWGYCHFYPGQWHCRALSKRPDWKHKYWVLNGTITRTGKSPWHFPPQNLQPNPYSHSRLFTVVRNPYTRVLSHHYNVWTFYGQARVTDVLAMNLWVFDQISKKMSHHPYWNGGALLPCHRYVRHGHNNITTVHEVLRFENLTNDFTRLMQTYNMNVTLPSRATESNFIPCVEKPGIKKLTPRHFCPQTLRLLNRYYKGDFDLFGYKMLPPNKSTVTKEICQWMSLITPIEN